PEIEIQITGQNMANILGASDELRAALATFKGVYDITDDYDAGRRELSAGDARAALPADRTALTPPICA
ncbi:MAG: hypothetical protein ACE5GW_13975, partial [Planctomycetota bacterium]